MRLFDWGDSQQRGKSPQNQARTRKQRRVVTLTILGVLAIGLLTGSVVVAMDLGSLRGKYGELQDIVDEATLRAAGRLIDERRLLSEADAAQAADEAREIARDYIARNTTLPQAISEGSNDSSPSHHEATTTIEIGYLANTSRASGEMAPDNPAIFNAVRVRVTTKGESYGSTTKFFANLLGIAGASSAVEATAVIHSRIRGFESPGEDRAIPVLPFALDLHTWKRITSGKGADRWGWDRERRIVRPGSDDFPEANLYPREGGLADRRGTLDIGTRNRMHEIARQIRHGVSPNDLRGDRGVLMLDGNRELLLRGDQGISMGVQESLNSIRGEARVLPIFEATQISADRVEYKIVKLVGVRVMNVQLAGAAASKRVLVQPAAVVAEDAIRTSETGTSEFVFAPPRLIQ